MTARPAFELADVFRRHGEVYIQANARHLGRIERRVIGAVAACRTAALGGHVERCDDCGLTRIAYNSCRNRHCPKCQAAARAKWLAARQAELLPVPYFHVVFTLPPAAAEIAFQNKQTVYGLLIRAAAEALMTLAAARLDARIGLIAVLHTWGQTLTHHPHVHCLVPGGGVALDGRRWVACRPNFLLSVRALSKTFRRLFLEGLEAAFRRGELGFFSELAALADPAAFAERVHALRQSAFVVYAKPPFGGPERVLAYLARYTHRTAIANSRLGGTDSRRHGGFAPCHQRSDCERIIRRRSFGRWPGGRRTSTRADGFCRWLRSGMEWIGDRRRRSAAWIARPCATGCIASTPRVRRA